MNKILAITFLCILGLTVHGQNSEEKLPANKLHARISPEWINQGIIYQIQPRAFTEDGTLKAATRQLEQIAASGATIIYLCPIFVADDDTSQKTWSPRQIASRMNNAKNPYRMMDYYHVDPEYGTDDDLKVFVNECHRLGMRIMLDMVYLHCGSRAVFLKENPDFIKRDKEGEAIKAAWNWPALNFENEQLREYLWKNMEYWVKEFDVDGFRCDVSDGVPLDFWEIARKRLEFIRPDIAMLAEGERKEDQITAFDLNYSFTWFSTLKAVYGGKKTALDLRETWEKMSRERPQGARFIYYTDNHDIANDSYNDRVEKTWGFSGVNAALVVSFTIDGVPFLYNGQEVADIARHSIFGKAPIAWDRANTYAGQMRSEFLQKLCVIRKEEHALTNGEVMWLGNDQPQSVLSYIRNDGREQILTIVNLSNYPVSFKIESTEYIRNRAFKSLVENGIISGDINSGFEIQAYGFLVGKMIASKEMQ
jgi:glycosidase